MDKYWKWFAVVAFCLTLVICCIIIKQGVFDAASVLATGIASGLR